ncbi:MAG: hypothetical protein LBK99_06085 [Opitutaceae bacterium]|nr:hypothetical protein [Opitutaceae bacterium]
MWSGPRGLRKRSPYPLGIFDWIDAIDGDKDIFGRVYLAFTSTGLVYGDISGVGSN